MSLGPLLVGAAQFGLALLFWWLGHWRDPPTLRSPLARVLALILAGGLFAMTVANLPFSLGLCQGGVETSLTCPAMPWLEQPAVGALGVIVVLASLTMLPAGMLAVAVAEALTRIWVRFR